MTDNIDDLISAYKDAEQTEAYGNELNRQLTNIREIMKKLAETDTAENKEKINELFQIYKRGSEAFIEYCENCLNGLEKKTGVSREDARKRTEQKKDEQDKNNQNNLA